MGDGIQAIETPNLSESLEFDFDCAVQPLSSNGAPIAPTIVTCLSDSRLKMMLHRCTHPTIVAVYSSPQPDQMMGSVKVQSDQHPRIAI